jgi:hypothetical protein
MIRGNRRFVSRRAEFKTLRGSAFEVGPSALPLISFVGEVDFPIHPIEPNCVPIGGIASLGEGVNPVYFEHSLDLRALATKPTPPSDHIPLARCCAVQWPFFTLDAGVESIGRPQKSRKGRVSFFDFG